MVIGQVCVCVCVWGGGGCTIALHECQELCECDKRFIGVISLVHYHQHTKKEMARSLLLKFKNYNKLMN